MTARLPRRTAALAAAALAAGLAVPAAAGTTHGSAASAAAEPPRVLVWGGSYGFRHPSITKGELTFLELAQETGDFEVTITENPADLSMRVLQDYDVLAWISTTGKPPLTEQQREDVIRFASCGGGNMGFHAALDSDYGWAEHAELFGAQFDSHPKGAGSGAARMLVEDRDHPITEGWSGSDSFMLDDEYYRWRSAKGVPGISLPRNDEHTDVLLSLDETTVGGDIQDSELAYEHHQPIAWTKTFRGDGGRVYYNNMGHSESTWDDAAFRTALSQGVDWVSEVRADQECLAGTSDVSSKPVPPAPVQSQIGKACPLPAGVARTSALWEASGEARTLTPEGDSVPVDAGLLGGLRWGAQHWVLDLSSVRGATADVTVTASWPVPLDDYDLSVTTGWGFYGSHALPGVTSETLVLEDVPHCGDLQVYADNMYAVSGEAPTLSATVSSVAARPSVLRTQ